MVLHFLSIKGDASVDSFPYNPNPEENANFVLYFDEICCFENEVDPNFFSFLIALRFACAGVSVHHWKNVHSSKKPAVLNAIFNRNHLYSLNICELFTTTSNVHILNPIFV